MKIAIIGGGASGLITAYLLQDAHDVVLFERQPILGGNIRTLNGNVGAPASLGSTRIENGVLGFHQQSYPKLHSLFRKLGVDLKTGQPTTALYHEKNYFPSNPRHFASPTAIAHLIRSRTYRSLLQEMRTAYAPALRKITRQDEASNVSLENMLTDNSVLRNFMQSLAALAFSTPFEQATGLPSALVSPYLRSTRHPDWTFIVGGVYAYVERLLAGNGFQVECNAGEVKVRRSMDGVDVLAKGEAASFDKVVIATTPGQVHKVLDDIDEMEAALFAPWQDHEFRTIAHTEMSFYHDFRRAPKTPMDMFASFQPDGPHGYNSYMNSVYGLDRKVPYSFAYNMDALIPERRRLHTANHIVPTYSVRAADTRAEIQSLNGRNNTFFVGAYLGNGLHEGAATSALTVSKTLGGDQF